MLECEASHSYFLILCIHVYVCLCAYVSMLVYMLRCVDRIEVDRLWPACRLCVFSRGCGLICGKVLDVLPHSGLRGASPGEHKQRCCVSHKSLLPLKLPTHFFPVQIPKPLNFPGSRSENSGANLTQTPTPPPPHPTTPVMTLHPPSHTSTQDIRDLLPHSLNKDLTS